MEHPHRGPARRQPRRPGVDHGSRGPWHPPVLAELGRDGGGGRWVSIGGVRKRLGPMFYSPTGIAYWVGDVALLAHVPTGSTFGVSLSDATGTATSPDPVLAGTL
jgi:hypothetical protein